MHTVYSHHGNKQALQLMEGYFYNTIAITRLLCKLSLFISCMCTYVVWFRSPPGGKVPPDEVIAKFEEHEDSVYSVVWSTADAWVFASLSYDGRLVLNHVPPQEKFSILTS